MRTHGQRLADVPASQHLDGPLAADEAALAHQFRRDVHTGVEALGQRVEVHDLVFLPERVVEAALWHAPVQRHLAALEPALVLEPGTRLRALVPAAGGFPVAGTLPAPDTLL